MRPQVPPRFRTIAIKDRDDDTVWAVMAEPDGDFIKLVSPPPQGFRGEVFEAFSGPWIESTVGPLRLFVRGGALGYDRPPFKVLTRPVFAPERVRAHPRRDVFFRVVSPADFASSGVLSYLTGDVL